MIIASYVHRITFSTSLACRDFPIFHANLPFNHLRDHCEMNCKFMRKKVVQIVDAGGKKNRSRYPNLKGNWSTTRNAFVLISIEQTLANMLLAAISFLFLVKFGPTTCSTHQDSYFRGSVEDTILNTDWMTCLQACHNKASCISYNYGGKMKTCEMISDGVTNQCDSGKVIYSRGWVFHQIRVRTM